jgi:glucose-6-phosphate isomerase
MTTLEMGLGPYRAAVENALRGMTAGRVVERIHELDHTVWKMDPKEITNRLGWLASPFEMRTRLDELRSFARQTRKAGYMDALLLGMGGSSLAPEVFARTFGAKAGHPDLDVLDSTDPAAVQAASSRIDPSSTLFIVSTKSGTTVETLSFFAYLYRLLAEALGPDRAGEHFIAVTDPGTTLNDTARRCRFRRVFAGEPTIGGRFSALSVFGLLPAALLGVDLEALLDRAIEQARNCRIPDASLNSRNRAAALGAALGVLALAGRDKLTFFISEAVGSFGDWVEQLVAESTGKEGKGILPVVGEAPGGIDVYGPDRVFVSLSLKDRPPAAPDLGRLVDAGHPVVRIFIDDLYDLGGLFYLWEFATAVAGHVMGINPFDQPDVEAAKAHARAASEEYRRTGRLDAGRASIVDDGLEVHGETRARGLKDALRAFLLQAGEGSYLAVQAYLNPTAEVRDALDRLRTLVRDRCRIAVTVGFGPRYLHSTGQLHKGDSGKGLFLQITSEDLVDIPIPDDPLDGGSSMSFGVLKKTQWMGDAMALASAGRRVMRLHITEGDTARAVGRICSALA